MATSLGAKAFATIGSARARVRIKDTLGTIIEKLRPAHRNRAMKAAGIAAGWDWISSALPLRFTEFAQQRLGYDARKMHRVIKGAAAVRAARAMMRVSGEEEQIVTAATAGKYGGWNPYGPRGPSRAVFTAWMHDALERKLIVMSDPPQWGLFRVRMRADVKRELALEARLTARANEIAQAAGGAIKPIPLVDSGWLQKTAPARARPSASNTQGGNGLAIKIVIPRGNRVHPMVTQTLKAITGEEVDRVGTIVADRFERFIADAVATNRAGKPLPAAKAAKAKYRSLSEAANRGIERLIRSSMSKSRLATYESHNRRGKK